MRTATVGLLVLSSGACGLARAETFERTLAAETRGVVEISNVAGRTEVTGWDRAEVQVQADVSAARISAESSGGRVSVRVQGADQFGAVNLTIHVPRGSELDVSGVSADIATAEVDGRLQLKTVSGRVKADVFQKETEVKTVSGDVVLNGRGKDPGADGIHVSSVSGSIRVERAGGDLEAVNVSGDMELQLDHAARDIRVRSTSGNVIFKGRLSKDGNLEAQTVSGNLAIHAAPEGALDYEINTFSGDISNCMGVEAQPVSQHAPGKRLTGTSGTAGQDAARVRLKSMSGNVELCNKT